MQRRSTRTFSVHPRVRGERAIGGLRQLATVRFIPACAGNAAGLPTDPSGATVHPRVRGERTRCPCALRYRPGSSPRARGTLALSRIPRFAGRFIPACAGNASIGRVDVIPHPVHPRVRGERSCYHHEAYQRLTPVPHGHRIEGCEKATRRAPCPVPRREGQNSRALGRQNRRGRVGLAQWPQTRNRSQSAPPKL